MTIKIAVVTGSHAFEVGPFHDLFCALPGINAYIQHLDDFASSSEKVRDEYAAVVFYLMPVENPVDDDIAWYRGKPRSALLHLGSTPQGIVLLHHGLVAYPGWQVWDEIAGVSGRVNSSYHIDQQFLVEIAAPDHPIVKGLSSWKMIDETYVILNFRPEGQVLLRTTYFLSWPVLAWVRSYQNARVFCYQSGHDSHTYADENFRSVLANGIRWTARVL